MTFVESKPILAGATDLDANLGPDARVIAGTSRNVDSGSDWTSSSRKDSESHSDDSLVVQEEERNTGEQGGALLSETPASGIKFPTFQSEPDESHLANSLTLNQSRSVHFRPRVRIGSTLRDSADSSASSSISVPLRTHSEDRRHTRQIKSPPSDIPSHQGFPTYMGPRAMSIPGDAVACEEDPLLLRNSQEPRSDEPGSAINSQSWRILDTNWWGAKSRSFCCSCCNLADD